MSVNSENDPVFNDAVPKPSSRRGFRIIELLVVVGIIAILIALMLPAVRTAGPAARRSQCVNNLKQIALALHNYELEHGALPPAHTVDTNGRPLHSWRTLLLPFLDQEPLYRTIDLAKPWNAPVNAKALETTLPVFRCPESVGPQNRTTYLAITGPNGCLIPKESRSLAEITDAHESTLVVVDAGEENAVPWMAPVDSGESFVLRLGPSTRLHHAGGTNACRVDGSVTFMKASTPVPVRRALMSISGDDDEVTKDW